MWDLILNHLDVIITGLITLIIALVGGTKWGKIKGDASQVRLIIDTICDALEDDKLTQAEITAIINAVKKLFPNIGKKDDKHVSQ